MTPTTIITQAVEWLEKMGVKAEWNAELNQYEFEYRDAFVFIHTDTPEEVISFTCPFVFADESSAMNKSIFEKANKWWSEHICTEHCFCEFVDNSCAYICCLYGRNRTDALRKYELIEMLNDAVSKWEFFTFAMSIAEKTTIIR